MFLILAGFAGLLSGLFIHWLTWYMRLHQLTIAVILGALAALGLTGFFLLYLTSDIADIMLMVLIVLWAIALRNQINKHVLLRMSNA